jgi:cytochrome c556
MSENYAMFRKISVYYTANVLRLAFGALFLVARVLAWQSDSMAGMDMGGKSQVMKDMGPSMAAMAGHMIMTQLRPEQPGDMEKAKAVVEQARATMERYQDYKNALADGYVWANPEAKQTQYHFMNDANGSAAETRFDPTKPTALLYRKTPHQKFKLEGVMYTAGQHTSVEELDKRIPTSIVRWHEHTNFCAAPEGKTDQYFGAHPKFGMFGSIKTQEACDKEHGHFYPFMFSWMIHVFPYEKDFKDVFSMNDDVAHVH